MDREYFLIICLAELKGYYGENSHLISFTLKKKKKKELSTLPLMSLVKETWYDDFSTIKKLQGK